MTHWMMKRFAEGLCRWYSLESIPLGAEGSDRSLPGARKIKGAGIPKRIRKQSSRSVKAGPGATSPQGLSGMGPQAYL